LDTIQLPSGLTDLALAGNYLGTYAPTNLPANLKFIDLRYNNLNTLPMNNFPESLLYVNFQYNQFDITSINNIAVHFDNVGLTNGQLFINNNTPPVSPTGTGLTAKTDLLAKGWEVGTD
jgi:hypothetical protein